MFSTLTEQLKPVESLISDLHTERQNAAGNLNLTSDWLQDHNTVFRVTPQLDTNHCYPQYTHHQSSVTDLKGNNF